MSIIVKQKKNGPTYVQDVPPNNPSHGETWFDTREITRTTHGSGNNNDLFYYDAQTDTWVSLFATALNNSTSLTVTENDDRTTVNEVLENSETHRESPYKYKAVVDLASGDESNVTTNEKTTWKWFSMDYANPGGTGDRTSSITATTEGDPFNALGNDQTTLVDGVNDSGTVYFRNVDVTGQRIIFDFGDGNTKLIREAKWYQSNTVASHGTWKWVASDDGATWTDVSSSFTLGGTTILHNIDTSGVFYRYYALEGVSGTSDGGPYIHEVEFDINDSEANSNTYAQMDGVAENGGELIVYDVTEDMPGLVVAEYSHEIKAYKQIRNFNEDPVPELFVEAITAGVGGNSITIAFVDPAAPSQALDVTVSSTDITVNLATDGSSVLISTMDEIATAINNDTEANVLISASAEIDGLAEAFSAVNLQRGSTTLISDQIDCTLKESLPDTVEIFGPDGTSDPQEILENSTLTGSTHDFTAILTRTDGTTEDVTELGTWSLSGVTTEATISDTPGTKGQVTTNDIEADLLGSMVVEFELTEDAGVTDTLDVDIIAARVESVEIREAGDSAPPSEMLAEESVDLDLKITWDDGHVTWGTTANTSWTRTGSLLTINAQTGLVEVTRDVDNRVQHNITATYSYNYGVETATHTIYVTVPSAPDTGGSSGEALIIDGPDEIIIGQSCEVKAFADGGQFSGQTDVSDYWQVTWATDNSLTSVSDNFSNPPVFQSDSRANDEHTVTFNATWDDNVNDPVVADPHVLTIKKASAVYSSITVSGANVLRDGDVDIPYTAEATLVGGGTEDVTTMCVWTIDDAPGSELTLQGANVVAEILDSGSDGGKVSVTQAEGVAQAQVKATLGNRNGTKNVLILPASGDLSGLEVSGATEIVTDTQDVQEQYTATLTLSTGVTQDITQTADWSVCSGLEAEDGSLNTTNGQLTVSAREIPKYVSIKASFESVESSCYRILLKPNDPPIAAIQIKFPNAHPVTTGQDGGIWSSLEGKTNTDTWGVSRLNAECWAIYSDGTPDRQLYGEVEWTVDEPHATTGSVDDGYINHQLATELRVGCIPYMAGSRVKVPTGILQMKNSYFEVTNTLTYEAYQPELIIEEDPFRYVSDHEASHYHIDGTELTLWQDNDVPDKRAAYLALEFDRPKVLNKLELTIGDDVDDAPFDVAIQYSMTGNFLGEEIIVWQTSGLSWEAGETKEFKFSNVNASLYYRVLFANASDKSCIIVKSVGVYSSIFTGFNNTWYIYVAPPTDGSTNISENSNLKVNHDPPMRVANGLYCSSNSQWKFVGKLYINDRGLYKIIPFTEFVASYVAESKTTNITATYNQGGTEFTDTYSLRVTANPVDQLRVIGPSTMPDKATRRWRSLKVWRSGRFTIVTEYTNWSVDSNASTLGTFSASPDPSFTAFELVAGSATFTLYAKKYIAGINAVQTVEHAVVINSSSPARLLGLRIISTPEMNPIRGRVSNVVELKLLATYDLVSQEIDVTESAEWSFAGNTYGCLISNTAGTRGQITIGDDLVFSPGGYTQVKAEFNGLEATVNVYEWIDSIWINSGTSVVLDGITNPIPHEVIAVRRYLNSAIDVTSYSDESVPGYPFFYANFPMGYNNFNLTTGDFTDVSKSFAYMRLFANYRGNSGWDRHFLDDSNHPKRCEWIEVSGTSRRLSTTGTVQLSVTAHLKDGTTDTDDTRFHFEVDNSHILQVGSTSLYGNFATSAEGVLSNRINISCDTPGSDGNDYKFILQAGGGTPASYIHSLDPADSITFKAHPINFPGSQGEDISIALTDDPDGTLSITTADYSTGEIVIQLETDGTGAILTGGNTLKTFINGNIDLNTMISAECGSDNTLTSLAATSLAGASASNIIVDSSGDTHTLYIVDGQSTYENIRSTINGISDVTATLVYSGTGSYTWDLSTNDNVTLSGGSDFYDGDPGLVKYREDYNDDGNLDPFVVNVHVFYGTQEYWYPIFVETSKTSSIQEDALRIDGNTYTIEDSSHQVTPVFFSASNNNITELDPVSDVTWRRYGGPFDCVNGLISAAPGAGTLEKTGLVFADYHAGGISFGIWASYTPISPSKKVSYIQISHDNTTYPHTLELGETYNFIAVIHYNDGTTEIPTTEDNLYWRIGTTFKGLLTLSGNTLTVAPFASLTTEMLEDVRSQDHRLILYGRSAGREFGRNMYVNLPESSTGETKRLVGVQVDCGWHDFGTRLFDADLSPIYQGNICQFVAKGIYNDGSQEDVTSDCSWGVGQISSTGLVGTSHATINQDGLLTAVGSLTGKVLVTANYNEWSPVREFTIDPVNGETLPDHSALLVVGPSAVRMGDSFDIKAYVWDTTGPETEIVDVTSSVIPVIESPFDTWIQTSQSNIVGRFDTMRPSGTLSNQIGKVKFVYTAGDAPYASYVFIFNLTMEDTPFLQINHITLAEKPYLQIGSGTHTPVPTVYWSDGTQTLLDASVCKWELHNVGDPPKASIDAFGAVTPLEVNYDDPEVTVYCKVPAIAGLKTNTSVDYVRAETRIAIMP